MAVAGVRDERSARSERAALKAMREIALEHFSSHPDEPIETEQLLLQARQKLQACGDRVTDLALSQELLALMDSQVVKWDQSFRLVPGRSSHDDRQP